MSVTLISKPEVFIGSSLTVSRTGAVHQPLTFVFKREDFQIESGVNSSGKVLITTEEDFVSGEFPVDGYVKLVTSVSNYNGVWKILSFTAPNQITLDLNFTLGLSAGYLNSMQRKNWRIESRILKRNYSTGSMEQVGTDVRKGSPNDEIPVSASPYLKPYVLMDDTFTYNFQNYGDKFESGSYQLEYRVVYNSIINDPATTFEYRFVNSIMQPRYAYGSNMAHYMYGGTGDELNWLTMFIRPTFFLGFPFCLNFLYITNSEYQIKQNEVFYDQNGNELADENRNILLLERGFLNRTMIFPYTGVLGSFSSAFDESFDVGTAPGEYYGRKIDVKLIIESPDLDVSKTITVDVDGGCAENPVYLNWLGTDGSRNFWLFKKRQTISIDTNVNVTFEPIVSDLAIQRHDVLELERTSDNLITCTAIVPLNKIEGIKTMLHSLNVLMLVNPDTWQDSVPIWEAVRPVTGTFALYNTDERFTTIQFTIQRISTNIQSR